MGAASPCRVEALCWISPLLQALRLLAGGRPVIAVALDVGYDTPSASIATFKSFFGAAPARYFD